MTVEYEPYSARWRPDPYPVYRELRDRDPVHFAPESNCYCVSRYDDALWVLKHPELFSSSAMFTVLMNGGQPEPPPLSFTSILFMLRYALRVRLNPLQFPTARNLIASDPPVHGPMRNIVNRGFTPRQIAACEPRIRALAVEQVAALTRGESFDVVKDLAIPLPVTIIAEMLGVEAERRADFKRWSDLLIEGTTGARRDNIFHPETVRTIIELNGYIHKMIRKRRREPRDDLISTIATEAPDGEKLSTMEVVQFVQLLMIAGNETTTNLIGNAVNALLDHPDELLRLSADPARVPDVIEEALRYDSPVQMVFRTTTQDVEVHGTRIPAGCIVAVILGSANRDERRFPDPDVLDPDRRTQGHLAFGFGQHFCLGASLARLEARVALEALAPELPRLERRTKEREMLDSFLVRGASRLELRRVA